MGAVGGVAILGGNFEAPQFPEDKTVQRSLTAGTQETTPIDAIILDSPDIGAPGQRDSHATVWKGHSNDGSPHSIDWKVFVDVTDDDGTGSLWTLQTRIDAAPYVSVLTIDDNGLLTVSGATFTMDQLIVDTDNAEAVLIRKDGDAGDVFIVDTINSLVEIGASAALTTGSTPAATGTIRISNVDSMNTRNAADDADLNIISFNTSNQMSFGDAVMPQIFVKTRTDFEDRVLIMSGGPTSTGALLVGNALNVDTTNLLVAIGTNAALETGATPAASGQIRMSYADSLSFRNAGDSGDLLVISTGDSNEFNFGDAAMSLMRMNAPLLITNRIRITQTSTTALAVNNDGNTQMFVVDTSGNIVTLGRGVATTAPAGTAVDRLIIDAIDLSVNSTRGFSHSFLIVGKSRTSGSVLHDSNWRMYVEPLTTTAFDGQSLYRITAEIDTGGPTTVFTLSDAGDLTIPGDLTVSGAGPHAIAGTPSGIIGLLISETFTSDGSATLASGVYITQTLVGASGDTTSLTGTTFVSAITTQTETEGIANISQVEINEPFITDNLTGVITNAQSLLITGAPTEGASNWAMRLLSGNVEIGGDLIEFGAGGGNSRMLFRGCSTYYIGNLDTPDEMFLGIDVGAGNVTVESAAASFDGSTWKFRTQAANSQYMAVEHVSAVVATPSGSSVTAVGLIPSGSFPVGITTRVITAITGPSGYDVGDGVDVDRWGASISGALSTTSDISDFTSGAVTTFPSANDVVITSDGVDFTGGSIRLTVHYMRLQAPES